MSTLGYGMYGLNVLNSNGETDSLPMCRVSNIAILKGDGSFFFTESVDEYGMAVLNQPTNSGTYSSIRTAVAGLYEIELCFEIFGQGGAGVTNVTIYGDKTYNLQTSGSPNYNLGNSFVITQFRQAVASSAAQGVFCRCVLFLDRDVIITPSTTGVSGTAPSQNNVAASYFTVRCISTENSGKWAAQP